MCEFCFSGITVIITGSVPVPPNSVCSWEILNVQTPLNFLCPASRRLSCSTLLGHSACSRLLAFSWNILSPWDAAHPVPKADSPLESSGVPCSAKVSLVSFLPPGLRRASPGWALHIVGIGAREAHPSLWSPVLFVKP